MVTARDKLLILDLDETLVYATEQPLAQRKADFRAGPYHVYKRPFVEELLSACAQCFEMAVWSSSSPHYAAAVVQALFVQPESLSFIWASDRCTKRFDPECAEYYWRKNLKKVLRRGYRLESVIVVDDSPEKWEQSYGNLVRVTPYLGQEPDEELRLLWVYLDRLRTVGNIRAVEKRGWQKQVAQPFHAEVTGT